MPANGVGAVVSTPNLAVVLQSDVPSGLDAFTLQNHLPSPIASDRVVSEVVTESTIDENDVSVAIWIVKMSAPLSPSSAPTFSSLPIADVLLKAAFDAELQMKFTVSLFRNVSDGKMASGVCGAAPR